MKRGKAYYRSQAQRVVRNRRKFWLQFHPEETRFPGRMKKHKPLDCGNARCLLCHYDKVLKKRRFNKVDPAEFSAGF